MNRTPRLHGASKKPSHNHVYIISQARQGDVPQLATIELAAADLLAGHAPDSVLRETTSLSELRYAQSQGRLWVALVKDVPVGFAHVEVIEPLGAHLKEIDVHPDHGRRGIGTSLVTAVCNWAALAGYACVTLTTFRDVSWNMPFYAKLGFLEVATTDLSSPLRSVVQDEARRGLDPARRVVMRRRVLPEGGI
jgi:GNAT superfamily N-acetyltransferase